MYRVGYDIGSSSMKPALVDLNAGKKVAIVQHPASEIVIQARWAEQHPDTWWRLTPYCITLFRINN